MFMKQLLCSNHLSHNFLHLLQSIFQFWPKEGVFRELQERNSISDMFSLWPLGGCDFTSLGLILIILKKKNPLFREITQY